MGFGAEGRDEQLPVQQSNLPYNTAKPEFTLEAMLSPGKILGV